MIDDAWQILAQPIQQFLTRHGALRRQTLDLIGAECLGEITGRNLLVRSLANPRVGCLAMAALLEPLQEVAKSAADHAAGRAAGEQAAQSALEKIAEASG